jgi:large repetitive protein
VTCVNDEPKAEDDTTQTDEDTAGNGNALANVDDVNGDTPEAELISGPAHADSFSLNPDSSYTYTPNANYHGTDIFTYKATDGTADSNVATVNITATSVKDPPKRRQHHRRRYGLEGRATTIGARWTTSTARTRS